MRTAWNPTESSSTVPSPYRAEAGHKFDSHVMCPTTVKLIPKTLHVVLLTSWNFNEIVPMEMSLLLNQGSEIWIAHICPYGTTRYGPAHTIYRQYQMRLFDLLNDRKASNQISQPTTHETKIRRPNIALQKATYALGMQDSFKKDPLVIAGGRSVGKY